ncbi:MAG TPA: PQQ-binding-like beta-propeller repeat protein [Solirubrobacteraceae bacterium]|jgi:outer membrane protein assembly factor BamB|nr:PQQ-binding-like beta-propeller repeat protein [Solirubrobacteraceae bacterium]
MRRRLQIMTRAAGLLVTAVAGFMLAATAAAAAVPAWTTYNHDGGRSATDPDSTTPVAPAVAWSTAALDGPAYAQPLVYGSRVYVATENDTIYALDAATGAVVWQRSVGTPVPAGSLPCGDISPTVGITSTPVIDPAAGRIYAVADVLAGGAVHHQLAAVDLTTGAPVAGFPVAVDPPGQDPKAILQRSALALDAGRVIIPYGGNDGDCSTYHGWLVSVAESGTGAQAIFEVDSAPGESQGAIWGAGDGPSQDGGGHLFVETGNGNSSTLDYQESVVELDPSLNVIAHWAPSNWKALDSSDTDLGSSEPLPLPGGLLFVAGKDGIGRLVSATALTATGEVFSAPVCASGGVFGASLYSAGVVYVPCSGGLRAVSLSGTSFTPRAGFSAPAAAIGPPIFAGGLVWSTGWNTGTLYGLDPATGAIRFQTAPGNFAHFATPSAGGGRLFMAAGSRVSALTIASVPPATARPPVVSPPPPKLSGVRLAPRRFTARHGTTLRLTLSQTATVEIQVSRVFSGRTVRHRCRVGARHGRRCTVTHRARRFAFHGRAGSDRFRLNTRGLRAGGYVATIVAVGAGGRASRTVTLRFQILRSQR